MMSIPRFLSIFILVAFFSSGLVEKDVVGRDSVYLSDYTNLDDVSIGDLLLRGVPAVPYRSFADSTFAPHIANSEYFHLETFEDGELNTPGIQDATKHRSYMYFVCIASPVPCSGPFIEIDSPGVVRSPGTLTDSIDLDDGSFDNRGLGGHSYHKRSFHFSDIRTINGVTSITHRLEFRFDESDLDALPDAFGFTWTDGVPGGYLTVETIDSQGIVRNYAATNGASFFPPLMLGDEFGNGTTEEDRFIGITSPTDIEQVTIEYITEVTSQFPSPVPRTPLINPSQFNDDYQIVLPVSDSGFEIDHLQYGRFKPITTSTGITTVPEPATFSLVALGFLFPLAWRRNR